MEGGDSSRRRWLILYLFDKCNGTFVGPLSALRVTEYFSVQNKRDKGNGREKRGHWSRANGRRRVTLGTPVVMDKRGRKRWKSYSRLMGQFLRGNPEGIAVVSKPLYSHRWLWSCVQGRQVASLPNVLRLNLNNTSTNLPHRAAWVMERLREVRGRGSCTGLWVSSASDRISKREHFWLFLVHCLAQMKTDCVHPISLEE